MKPSEPTIHQAYLKAALQLAQQRKGYCAPNPAVGAVLVKAGKIVGQGNHFAAGQPHAEINAIHDAGENARGATLYITLEPCCHFGRTPPCTTAIIAAQIKAVYFAFLDPNPQVNHQGQLALSQANIPCELIPLPEISKFYRSYKHWILTKYPWVQIKLAISLDGKIAHHDGSPAHITQTALQTFTHQQRLAADALLTTINTVHYDNPALNVRLTDPPIRKKIYLLDSHLKLAANAQIRHTAATLTIFHSPQADPQRIHDNTQQGIHCIAIPHNAAGLDLPIVLQHIGADGVHDLWVEAGGYCFNHFITQQLAHEVWLYLAPKTLGINAKAAFNTALDFMRFYDTIDYCQYQQDVICHMWTQAEKTILTKEDA